MKQTMIDFYEDSNGYFNFKKMKHLTVLVACEESQEVTKAFRSRGHYAYSCDIIDCSGGHPEWHIKGDVREHLDSKWDLIIAHPPCTYLSNSGVCWLYRDGKKENGFDPDRMEKMRKGAEFFKLFLDLNIPVCIENPIMHKYAVEIIGRRQDQVIQPWMFGHMEQKATCLWLKGLPKLQPTNNVKKEMMELPDNKRQRLHYLPPGEERQKERSKTFEGIAKAMAEQWGRYF